METPAFDAVCGQVADRALARDLRRRPVPRRPSGDAVLDPATAVVAGCEPGVFRLLVRDWHGRDGRHRSAAEEITEALHDRDLERAAQPPVIEVTVTTPPDGIPRADLERAVWEEVARVTGPAGMPVLPPDRRPRRRRRPVLQVTRRARPAPALPSLPVSEDDTPTEEIPVIRDGGGGFELVEVHVP